MITILEQEVRGADGAEGIINFVETGDDFDEIIVEQSRARSDDDALQLGKGVVGKRRERKSHIQMELLSVSRLLERAAHWMPTTLSLCGSDVRFKALTDKVVMDLGRTELRAIARTIWQDSEFNVSWRHLRIYA